jgi:hypothetical protein
MRARWYSTQLGEFLSPDEVGYAGSFNLYAYAGFDPINRWDPSGLIVKNYKEIQKRFRTGAALELLSELNARQDMTFEFVAGEPPEGDPKDWGGLDRSKAISEQFIKIVVNESKLNSATSAEAVYEEIAAHEGTHARNWTPTWQTSGKSTPREIEAANSAIAGDEANAYVTSLKVRLGLKLQTDVRWLQAHPGVEVDSDRAHQRRASVVLQNPTMLSVVEEIRRGSGFFPPRVPAQPLPSPSPASPAGFPAGVTPHDRIPDVGPARPHPPRDQAPLSLPEKKKGMAN